jgi:hypothetical protein
MKTYSRSKSQYVEIIDPVAYRLGDDAKGKEIVAWVGETSRGRVVFRDPVLLEFKTPEGETVTGYVSRERYSELTGEEFASSIQDKKLGAWEQAILDTVKQTHPSLAQVDLIIGDTIKKFKKIPGKKDRRREYLTRAMQSLLKGGVLIKKGDLLTIEEEDLSDLVA